MTIKKILFPVFLTIILLATTFIAVNNYQTVSKLQQDGKDPITVATPLAANDGKNGRDGDIGATGQTGADGQDGTPGKDGAAGIDGANGFNGQDGLNGTNGTNGTNGINGTNGQPVFMSCVIRTTNKLPTSYVAWKYQSAADSTYVDIYKLPKWAECVAPIDLR